MLLCTPNILGFGWVSFLGLKILLWWWLNACMWHRVTWLWVVLTAFALTRLYKACFALVHYCLTIHARKIGTTHYLPASEIHLWTAICLKEKLSVSGPLYISSSLCTFLKMPQRILLSSSCHWISLGAFLYPLSCSPMVSLSQCTTKPFMSERMVGSKQYAGWKQDT